MWSESHNYLSVITQAIDLWAHSLYWATHVWIVLSCKILNHILSHINHRLSGCFEYKSSCLPMLFRMQCVCDAMSVWNPIARWLIFRVQSESLPTNLQLMLNLGKVYINDTTSSAFGTKTTAAWYTLYTRSLPNQKIPKWFVNWANEHKVNTTVRGNSVLRTKKTT